jgi:hypothetical protein
MKTCEEENARSEMPSSRRPRRAEPDCILTVGPQRLPAAIDEERGGTMHVMVQGNPQFWVEDTGQLTTADAEISIRVFNIVRLEAADDDATDGIPTFRIGLDCLSQVDRQLHPGSPDLAVSGADNVDLSAKESPYFRLGGVMALTMVAAAAVLAVGMWQGQNGLRTVLGSWLNSVVRAMHVPNSAPSLQKPPDAVAVPAPQEALAELLRLPGTEPFLRPEVAKKLELTPDQKDACQRLNRIVQDAVEDLEKYWGGGGRLELAQKRSVLLDEARRQALLLLTEPQRKQWDELAQ